MPQAFFIKKTQHEKVFTFLYETEGFYFSPTVGMEHPFPSERSQVTYALDANGSLEDWARYQLGMASTDITISQTKNKPGYFFPRMWRGNMQNLDSVMLAGSQAILSKAIVAGELIVERLFDLFKYIEPIKDNQHVFSHKMRELLLLSCMEVESGWAAVLSANDYNLSDRPSTKDYVKLLDPLLLSMYEVEFSMYPEIDVIAPFKGWNANSPTKSLSWYDAYNNTKHNREDNFHYASLGNSINSVCAVAVMLCAQFGPKAVPHGIGVTLKNIDHNWPYIPLGEATRSIYPDGRTQNIGFNSSSTWRKENYIF